MSDRLRRGVEGESISPEGSFEGDVVPEAPGPAGPESLVAPSETSAQELESILDEPTTGQSDGAIVEKPPTAQDLTRGNRADQIMAAARDAQLDPSGMAQLERLLGQEPDEE